ncbi:MAG: hypothetical protein ACKV2U_01155 [Bryobacteraceae bacterium]
MRRPRGIRADGGYAGAPIANTESYLTRSNFTLSSYGPGLETGRRVPRQPQTTFDEFKTHPRGTRIILRSKTPDLVRQERHSPPMAHFTVRRKIAILPRLDIHSAIKIAK